MAATRTYARWLMVICLWNLAAMLVLGLSFSLLQAYRGSLIFAIYPGPLEFMGQRRLSGTIYVSIKWRRDPAAPGSCPLIVHLPAGDAGEAQFAANEAIWAYKRFRTPHCLPRQRRSWALTGIVHFRASLGSD
jgi:hypothetical protein